MDVSRAYFVVFGAEKSLIGCRFLPKLMPFIPSYDFPPFAPEAQTDFPIFNPVRPW